MIHKTLKDDLIIVGKLFDIKLLSSEIIGNSSIKKYYAESKIGYNLFHSVSGSVHMALNFDGKFSKDGYYEQIKRIQNIINGNEIENVLELGMGQGFNTAFLANLNPDRKFWGIDLTPSHYHSALKKVKSNYNVNFKLGDFQQLDFESDFFDLIFEIESVCHATDMRLVLNGANRVLKRGGRFVLFDGFRTPKFSNLESEIKLAAKLVEISMAVNHSYSIDDWINLALDCGFKVEYCNDISKAIKPNLLRFQKAARIFFNNKLINKIFQLFFPKLLIRNSIAGLLMPHTIDLEAQGYYEISLIKV